MPPGDDPIDVILVGTKLFHYYLLNHLVLQASENNIMSGDEENNPPRMMHEVLSFSIGSTCLLCTWWGDCYR